MISGSDYDLDRLIVEKRSEIEKEKVSLGLSPPPPNQDDKENSSSHANKPVRRVAFQESEKHDSAEDKKERDSDRSHADHEDKIPPDLERYIRRYIGLPGMLKAGEYSPNNPLVRGERAEGDVLLGLGEYERRRHTLRRLRQQQYREYLDLQAKKKQEEKQKAERERREREERERLREEERERQRQQEGEERRASVCYVSSRSSGAQEFHTKKVDTGVQVTPTSALSVAVQTDDGDLYGLPSPKSQLTQAERELSPRTVVDHEADERPIHPAWQCERDRNRARNEGDRERRRSYGDFDVVDHEADERPIHPAWQCERERNRARNEGDRERRRSYGDFDERPIKRPSRERLMSDLRHTHIPSILDADAIRLRNLQAEQEAAARRQQYQEELRNQIKEQQRIREERRTREKMLEQAEMRRLEEQLRMLKTAQEKEHDRYNDITVAMKENAADYDRKRTGLQKEIDFEKRNLRTISQPSHAIVKRNTSTSHSDSTRKLPFYYPKLKDRSPERNFERKLPFSTNLPDNTSPERNYQRKLPFSTNVPDNSIFSRHYDVDSYLRKNLNPSKESLLSNRINSTTTVNTDYFNEKDSRNCDNVVVENALIHENPKENGRNVLDKPTRTYLNLDERRTKTVNKPRYEPSFLRKDLDEITSVEDIPIPVLRHSPVNVLSVPKSDVLSDEMKKVEDKWKVPAVQKNILKSLPNDEGKNVSILTQLGSIRRQLQLEQLKLDMLPKTDVGNSP